MGSQQVSLLVDGYIANTFGSRAAEAYHSTLLRRDSGHLRPYNHPGYPGIFFAMSPLRRDLNPPPPQTPWTIDYVQHGGTVIQQQIWVTRNQYEFLRPPIFFVHNNGALGLDLIQARGGNCMSLRGASHTAPLDPSSSTHAQIRINWRGYSGWSEQISIRTQARAGPEIVRLETFVKHVAKKVYNFMTEFAGNYNERDERWYIGRDGITPNDVVLIGVVQVSQGSWMPILQAKRFLF